VCVRARACAVERAVGRERGADDRVRARIANAKQSNAKQSSDARDEACSRVMCDARETDG
jgi:hypothetical protein